MSLTFLSEKVLVLVFWEYLLGILIRLESSSKRLGNEIRKNSLWQSFPKALVIYLLNAERNFLNLGNGAHLRRWLRRNHVLKGVESEVYCWDSVTPPPLCCLSKKVPTQILSTHAHLLQGTWGPRSAGHQDCRCGPSIILVTPKIYSSSISGKGMGGRKATISPIPLLHSTYLEKNKTT